MENLTNETVHIRQVWSRNLEEEFELLRSVVNDFPFVGLDTEFPGTVVNPNMRPKGLHEAYNHMKANVDVLKIIQLGLTFSDERGNLPKCGTEKYCVWQFNFQGFDPDTDYCVKSSITMLREAGVEFEENQKSGVDPSRFGELLMLSGAVKGGPAKEVNVHWVVFQGGNDFGLLIRILTGGMALPETPEGFFELLKHFFPDFYDLRSVARQCGIFGGLKHVAKSVEARRVGRAHMAGSDSLLTLCAFLKVKNQFCNMPIGGVLYGLED